MAVVLDASVLIGFLNPSDEHHHRCRAALQHEDVVESRWVVPATVCAELLVGAYRSGLDMVEALERFLDEGTDAIEPVTYAVARSAARIRAEHARLSLSDAIVLATGREIGADWILTVDRAWARVDDRVRVV